MLWPLFMNGVQISHSFRATTFTFDHKIPATLLEVINKAIIITQSSDFTKDRYKTTTVVIFSRKFLDNTYETFQKSGKQDSSKRILKKSANMNESLDSSVIRQKGKSQNGCFKKTKHAKFSEK